MARDNNKFLLRMTEKFKYRAFLTYAHEDGEHAQKLRRALENFRVPSSLVGKETEFGPVPARLFPIFGTEMNWQDLPSLERLFRKLSRTPVTLSFCVHPPLRNRFG